MIRPQFILEATGADTIGRVETVQRLWAGYGHIYRVALEGAGTESVVVKVITSPDGADHPRGWHSDVSQQRKLKSYQIEQEWYLTYSGECDEHCRMPQYIAHDKHQQQFSLVMEDLDVCYPQRFDTLDVDTAAVCLRWLANFHARFYQQPPEGLWPIGCYWHLATRREEYDAMENGTLKEAASLLDEKLNGARHLTLVHGDAKVANFCFSDDKRSVAAVDFQYVGGGVGIRDVAYFIGSIFDETDCERHEESLLSIYFNALADALNKRQIDANPVIEEWRDLYDIAWTDFYRFLSGWMPTHTKIHRYTRVMAESALNKLY